MFVEITCWKCKVRYGMPEDYYRVAKQAAGNQTFYCINGHAAAFKEGPTEADVLRKKLETAQQQNAMWRDDAREQRERAEAAERSASAQRGVVTRLKNRAAAGVCPCCNRTFANLARHMAGQHPKFKAEEVA